jgi:hypothetical protein
MRALNLLSLFVLLSYGGINQTFAEPVPMAIATTFRAEDKVYITNLKPNSKIEINLQRITYRKLIADICGEVSFESSNVPALVLVGNQELSPNKFALEASRVCTKNSPKSDRSYKTSKTKFVLSGLKSQQPHLVQIMKSARKTIATNKCGYVSIPITKTLTPFSSSYADNIYTINGKRLKDMTIQKPPKC